MGISPISSVTSGPVSVQTSPDGDRPAVKAAGSKAAKVAEQANAGMAPKADTASAGKSSSSTNDLANLMMLASQHMSALQIAHQLGKSVSVVMEEAAAAGIHLSAGSAGDSSASTSSATKSAKAPTGKGTNIDATA